MALTLLHQPTIPLPTTSLVGREEELGRLHAMLGDPAIRLVTLTGPGGVGKTRLALQVAHEIDPEIAGDIHIVALAAIPDAAGVLPAIARAIGVSQSTTRPLDRAIASAIGDRRMLLILDNAEHVAEHLTPLASLLGLCRNLTMLVTSRVMLRLSAEVVLPLEPLATRGASATDTSPAMALFIERAQAVRPDLPLGPEDVAAIDEICRDLDGLPLAIELAAARTRFLSPVRLRARLGERLHLLTGGPRDAPVRHQTLRATLEWSHELLTRDERTVFRRLAVFRGSAPYDAVVPVVNASDDLHDAEELLGALIDHSLVRISDSAATGPRVRMLHTIREFAWEQLEVSGDIDTVAAAHANWFANDVTSQPYQNWGTGREELRDWTIRRAPDLQNLHAALEWLVPHGDPSITVPVVSNLVAFWLEVGATQSARAWVRRVEPLIPRVDTDRRMRIAYMRAVVEVYSDELDEAATHARQAIDLATEIDNLGMAANSQNLLGAVYWMQGDVVEGERLQRLAVATTRSRKDSLGGALFLANLGEHLAEHGEFARAEPLVRDALTAIAEHRPDALPLFQGSFASLQLRRGNLDEASEYLVHSLDYHRDPPHRQPYALAMRLCDVVEIACRRGRARESGQLFGFATDLFRRTGMDDHNETVRARDRAHQALAAELEADVLALEIAAGRALTIPDAIALAQQVARAGADRGASSAVSASLGLTERQLDVLRLLAEGKSNPAIAEALFISERTVTTHLTRIYDRLDVATRTEAVARATQLGLVGAAATSRSMSPASGHT